jgi:hypothetical protein
MKRCIKWFANRHIFGIIPDIGIAGKFEIYFFLHKIIPGITSA